MSILFRPPIITLAVQLAAGREIHHRLPQGLAAAGFLLSPYTETSGDYAALALNDRAAIAPRVVTSFALINEAGREADFAGSFEIVATPLYLPAIQP